MRRSRPYGRIASPRSAVTFLLGPLGAALGASGLLGGFAGPSDCTSAADFASPGFDAGASALNKRSVTRELEAICLLRGQRSAERSISVSTVRCCSCGSTGLSSSTKHAFA
eukprot:scaffold1704_cov246-Pinguiococcus_pyrenoidosus.AAC.17